MRPAREVATKTNAINSTSLYLGDILIELALTNLDNIGAETRAG